MEHRFWEVCNRFPDFCTSRWWFSSVCPNFWVLLSLWNRLPLLTLIEMLNLFRMWSPILSTTIFQCTFFSTLLLYFSSLWLRKWYLSSCFNLWLSEWLQRTFCSLAYSSGSYWTVPDCQATREVFPVLHDISFFRSFWWLSLAYRESRHLTLASVRCIWRNHWNSLHSFECRIFFFGIILLPYL